MSQQTTDNVTPEATTTDRTFQLGEVTIEGLANRDSSARLSSERIEKFNNTDLSNALNILPGVSIANVGPRNESVVYVRGFDLRQVPVFIDGVPVLAGTYTPAAQEMRGMQLFENGPVPGKMIRGANCGHCHGGPKTFKELFHNNGLDSIASDSGREKFTAQPSDRGRFRVPTLRNIMLTAPYMHDGRFETIEQVLDHYNEHIRQSATLSSFLKDISNETGGKTLSLSKSEKGDIISFLGMLNDSSFITNPEFSNPNLILKLP